MILTRSDHVERLGEAEIAHAIEAEEVKEARYVDGFTLVPRKELIKFVQMRLDALLIFMKCFRSISRETLVFESHVAYRLDSTLCPICASFDHARPCREWCSVREEA